MTAPDHFAKTDLNPFAGAGRPHMTFGTPLCAIAWGIRRGAGPRRTVGNAAVSSDRISDMHK
jgi:hypothetical protein